MPFLLPNNGVKALKAYSLHKSEFKKSSEHNALKTAASYSVLSAERLLYQCVFADGATSISFFHCICTVTSLQSSTVKQPPSTVQTSLSGYRVSE